MSFENAEIRWYELLEDYNSIMKTDFKTPREMLKFVYAEKQTYIKTGKVFLLTSPTIAKYMKKWGLKCLPSGHRGDSKCLQAIKALGNISKGERTKITPGNSEETSIYSVDFTPSTDLGEVTLSITKLEGKPEEIIEKPTIINQTIYVYLDIKLISDDGYVGEDKTESMKFEFKVAKTWINENNIDKETVILKRYHDEWQNLTTTYLSEDDTYVYYEAETPGLSTFAVVGSELIESSASYVEEAPEVPWILNMGIIASSSTMLFVVLFKARYIYLDEEDGVKGSKKRLSRKLR